jgi:hypothetical protein
MDPISAAIAAIGLTASRAFLPALVAAVLLRVFGDHEAARLASQSLLGTGQIASWFTSDWCIATLAILAAVEEFAQHNDDARAILIEVDHFAKPVMAFLLQLGLISATDASTADSIRHAATQHASLLGGAFAIVAGVGCFVVASARNNLQRLLHDIDPDNSTGVHRLVTWGEDLFAVFGTALLLLFPLVIAVLVGVGIAAMLLLERRARAREERAKAPCHACSQPIYLSAPACPNCHARNPSPRGIGFLGATTLDPADPVNHDLRLLAKRRCPTCATRLPGRSAATACPACSRAPLGEPRLVERYDAFVSARLFPVLLLTAVLGLIPIAGLVAAILLYRVALVSPYRVHVSALRSVLLKWCIRLAILLLVLLHLMPILGALAAPLMAMINYVAWRGAFLAATPSDRTEPSPTEPFPAGR